MKKIAISPSLLSADFSKLGAEIRALEKAGANRIHLDVMDGHFVPNITFGPLVINALRPYTTLPFETHLMIAPCDPFLAEFAHAGSDIILIHPESGPHFHRSLQTIKQLGKKAGIVLNPGTDLTVLSYGWDLIDQILVMTVNPGFSGQRFIEAMLPKIRHIRDLIGQRPIDLAVDGGITSVTAPLCLQAGANILIAGTAILGSSNYSQAIATLRAS